MSERLKSRILVRPSKQRSELADVTVLIVDGNEFRRDSLASLLSLQSGVKVTAVTSGIEATLRHLKHNIVDVLLVDINVTPAGAVKLFRLARSARESVGFIVLAEVATPEFASELLDLDVQGVGILSRADIRNTMDLISAIDVVAGHGTAISPELVSMLAGQNDDQAKISIGTLTPREREILAGVAQGLSNRALARELGIRRRTVENTVGTILQKLGERGHPDHDGRVCAALFYLKATGLGALTT